MSGRFTFTAGNTLTAAQLNTNVMNGILYKTQVGTSSVSLTSSATWSYGAVNVTNLSGFTQNPYVIATAEATTTTSPVLTHVNVTSTTAMTVYMFRAGASTASTTVRWLAMQATSTTAAGS
jgi:hypothetical protein